MGKRLLRNVALNLALFQMFYYGTLALKKKPLKDLRFQSRIQSDSGMIPKSSGSDLVKISDDGNFPVYERISEDGKQGPISIFDDRNINTKQYGANQQDFKNHFEQLISDPVIWEEMQKYYPVESFNSEEEAMFFYQQYFLLIYDSGCGYAAAANYVFHMFEGREEDFYNAFGYPMYTMGKYGIDFNYETFMLKFFNYSILEKYKQRKLVSKALEKEMLEFQLDEFVDSTKVSKPSRDWTEEQWDAWRKSYHEREDKIEDYEKRIANADDEDYNFGISLDDNFGFLYLYLRKHGVAISTSYSGRARNLKTDDIIASKKSTLYQIDGGGSVTYAYDVGLHYVYVTYVEEDQTIIVSSWGCKYIFDNSDVSNTYKINVKKR